MRAPSIGSRTATDQKRSRVGGKPRRRANRRGAGDLLRPVDPAGAPGVVVGDEQQAGRGVRVRAGRDDVLRCAAEEEEAQEVEAGVEVQVEGGRGEQDEREPDGGLGHGDEAAGERDRGVRGPDQRRLRVDVGGLDVDAAAERAQAPGEVVRGAPLGIGAGEAVLERAELVDRVEQRFVNAAGGTRTHKRFRAMAFETIAFASLATAACTSIVTLASESMCGRYTLANPDPKRLRLRFGLAGPGRDRRGAALQHRADRPGARGSRARGGA